MFHYKSISSTQDEMKSLLLNPDQQQKADYICITTESQTKGRGTNNRSWIGKRGNTFLTIAIPYDDIQIPLTLFPLQIGVVMAQNIHRVLEHLDLKDDMPNVTVKWPNDVLVNDKKIAGVLIENEKDCNGQYRFLVGIGVNNRYAPTVETTGKERGRETACIYDFKDNGDMDEEVAVMEARQLAVDIANDIKSWIEIQKIDPEGSKSMIVNTWLQWADFSRKFVLRDEPGNETVMPIDLESDGRLRVVGQDGKERLLCFDYLL